MIEKSVFFDELSRIFALNRLESCLSDEKKEDFYRLTQCILETNSVTNITAITDEREIILRHFADSLLLLEVGIESGSRVLDVGCGGGFPILPLGVARRDIDLLGIDSTAKKIEHVERTARTLGLSRLSALCGRAEELGSGADMRESFDLVTARAVSAMPILSELCLPFVKVGGRFAAMKAKSASEELAEALPAIKKLGGEVEEIKELKLISSCSKSDSVSDSEAALERRIIIVRKVSPTPKKYPRAYAQMKKTRIR